MDIGLSLKVTRIGGVSGGAGTITVKPVIENRAGNDPVEAGDILDLTTLPQFGGDIATAGYVWQANGADIGGSENTPNYTTPNNTTPATWRVRAWVTDSDGKTTNGYSNALTNQFLPAVTTAPLIQELDGGAVTSAKIGHTYKLTEGVYAANPAATISNPQFFVAGSLIASNGREATVPEQIGVPFKGREAVSNTVGTIAADTIDHIITYGEITITDIGTVTGTNKVDGSSLSHSDPTFDYPQGVTFTRQWQRGGVDIAGQTGSTYLKVAADYSASIQVQVSAQNPGPHLASGTTNEITIEVDPNGPTAPTLLSAIPDIQINTEDGDPQFIDLSAYFFAGRPAGTFSVEVIATVIPEWGTFPDLTLTAGETHPTAQYVTSGPGSYTYAVHGPDAVFTEGVFESDVFERGLAPDESIDVNTGVYTAGSANYDAERYFTVANTSGSDETTVNVTVTGGAVAGLPYTLPFTL